MDIDITTDFGRRVTERLQGELVVWLTTVDSDGTPQPRPVWFYWDGIRFVIYSQPDTFKLAHIEDRPQVSLNFDSDGAGGDIVVFTGRATLGADLPPADDLVPYVEKYRARMKEIGYTPEEFADAYSEPIAVTPDEVRGH